MEKKHERLYKTAAGAKSGIAYLKQKGILKPKPVKIVPDANMSPEQQNIVKKIAKIYLKLTTYFYNQVGIAAEKMIKSLQDNMIEGVQVAGSPPPPPRRFWELIKKFINNIKEIILNLIKIMSTKLRNLKAMIKSAIAKNTKHMIIILYDVLVRVALNLDRTVGSFMMATVVESGLQMLRDIRDEKTREHLRGIIRKYQSHTITQEFNLDNLEFSIDLISKDVSLKQFAVNIFKKLVDTFKSHSDLKTRIKGVLITVLLILYKPVLTYITYYAPIILNKVTQ